MSTLMSSPVFSNDWPSFAMELYNYMSWLKEKRHEYQFLEALNQTPESLKRAGRDHKEAAWVFSSLYLKHRLSLGPHLKLLDFPEQTVYYQEIVEDGRPLRSLWVFDKNGHFTANIKVAKESLKDALQIAKSIKTFREDSEKAKIEIRRNTLLPGVWDSISSVR